MIFLCIILYYVFSGDGGGYNDIGVLMLFVGLLLYLKILYIISLFLFIWKGLLYSVMGWRYMLELEFLVWYVLELL